MAAVNDTYFARQWGLNNTGQTVNGFVGTSDADIDMPEAWALETSAWTNTDVAVIDTGILYNHPDLINNIDQIKSYDFEDEDNTPDDPLDINGGGHGTHVAGIVAAQSNNTTGVSGMSKYNNLKLMVLKTDYTTAQLVMAINYAGNNGVKVINASWGCVDPDLGGSQMPCGAIPGYDYNDGALSASITAFPGIFVAAAGNGNGDGDAEGDDHDDPAEYNAYPCDLAATNIICVAATDEDDAKSSYSDFSVTTVDVGAPGGNANSNLYSTYPRAGTAFIEPFELEGGNPLVPPSVGDQLTEEGADNWWGTLFDGDVNWLWSDYFHANYLPNMNNSVVSDAINTSSSYIYAVRLMAYITCDTENTDPYGATSDYVALEAYDGANWTDVNRYNSNSLVGAFPSVNLISEDLTPFRNANLKFRLRWVSDADADDGFGCALWPLAVYSHSMSSAYNYLAGTSMAAPHVAGLAGMLWSFKPSLTIAQVKSAILTKGDSKAGLAGKTTTGRRINAYKSLASLDTTAPGGTSIKINNGASTTRSRLTKLYLGATDTGGFGLYRMRFSNNGTTKWSSWVTYATTYSNWNITSSTYGGTASRGTKKVYVQFKDKIGNTSTKKYDTIYYNP